MEPPILGCPICFQLLEEPRFLVCGHGFCLSCIEESLQHRTECPVCRMYIPERCSFNKIYVVDDAVEKIRLFVTQKNNELLALKQRMEIIEEEKEALEEEKEELKRKNTNLEANIGSYEKRLRESNKSLRKKRMRIKNMKTGIKNSIETLQNIYWDGILEENGDDDENGDEKNNVHPGQNIDWDAIENNVVPDVASSGGIDL